MLNANYVVWETQEVPNACVLDELSGVGKLYQIRKGIPRAEGFPTDAKFNLDPDYPNDTLLVDAFETTYRMIVISPALKAFLDAQDLIHVEFLPVAIIDHKGKPKANYFILHPVNPVDCLDIAASGVTWDEVSKDTISELSHLVLDKNKIDSRRPLFKIKYFYKYVIVRQDLAETISSQGFTGIKWTKTEDFRK